MPWIERPTGHYDRRMAGLRRRLLSWWWDYLAVLAWLLVVFLVVGLPMLLGWVDLEPVWSRQITADLAVTALTVVPYLVYLVRTEAGPANATWGKRRSGLVVEAADGSPTTSTGRIAVRNLVKVLPWQFGHAMNSIRSGIRIHQPTAEHDLGDGAQVSWCDQAAVAPVDRAPA